MFEIIYCNVTTIYWNVINTVNLIHILISLSRLFRFKASTCFGHHLPIFRSLSSSREPPTSTTAHNTYKSCVFVMPPEDGQWCPKHAEALNLNNSESESESKSKVCIKLVVFITLLSCTVNRTLHLKIDLLKLNEDIFENYGSLLPIHGSLIQTNFILTFKRRNIICFI
jgi:hypothetical protein